MYSTHYARVPTAAPRASHRCTATSTPHACARFSARQRLVHASSSATQPPCSTPDHGRGAVLVAPAFYLGSDVFVPLVKELRQRGYNAALPPIRWYDWVPTLGGRSVRPILDRIDYALTQLLNGHQVREDTGFEVQLPGSRSAADWLTEFRDASQGAQPPIPRAARPPAGGAKAALVASSAAGWISRILLADGPPYSGAVYHGADRVHTLVTLGSPHDSAEAVTLRNIGLVNKNYPGAHMPSVRYVAVGSKTVQGQPWLGGKLGGDFAWQSYVICCGQGDAWGDGVTPLQCALALEGAEHITLEGARHVPLEVRDGQHWYGSGPYLEAWVGWLDPPAAEGAVAAPAPARQQQGAGSGA